MLYLLYTLRMCKTEPSFAPPDSSTRSVTVTRLPNAGFAGRKQELSYPVVPLPKPIR